MDGGIASTPGEVKGRNMWIVWTGGNNPRTINAVHNVWPRREVSKECGRDTLGANNFENKQFNDFLSQVPLTQFFQPPKPGV